MKWKICVSVLVVVLLVVGVTKLIPAEEELPSSPVIKEYESSDYVMTTVEVGDIVSTKTITFKYNATSVEELSFAIDKCVIANVYVSEGDTVQEGDVLAELYLEDLQEELEECESDLVKLYLELEQTQEKYDLAYQTQVDYRATLTDEQLSYTSTPEEVVVSYISQIEEIEDEIWIENLRISELEESIAERQLVATMDGVISYVKAIDENSVSSKSTTFIEIMDSETSVFMATTAYENVLQVGESVQILIDKVYYDATIILPDGYTVYDEEEEKYDYYLELDFETIDLADGDTGKVDVIVEQSLDVLYVPEDALGLSKGEDVVYYLNDEGYRAVKYVEVGLISDGYAEIISGLTEGESIIWGLE